MRRFLALLFISISILASLSLSTAILPARAAGFCAPDSLVIEEENNFNTVLKIKRANLKQDETYRISVSETNIINMLGTWADGIITFNLGKLIPGKYKFSLTINSSLACSGERDDAVFTIPDIGQGGTTSVKSGSITFAPSDPADSDPIIITVTNLSKPGKYAIFVSNTDYAERYARNPELAPQTLCETSSNNTASFNIDPLATGVWQVLVTEQATNTEQCSIGGDRVAEGTITISTSSFEEEVTPTPEAFANLPCSQWAYPNGTIISPSTDIKDVKEKKCIAVDTAIGDISTDPAKFVQFIFSLVLGIAGGIALIIIMISGYKFMASQGNPEQVQAARDQLTSAIVGLLFIIFSFVILQVIGVDILKIPGFNP